MNTYQKEILFESRKKNMFIAYLLGCFLGGVSAHRLYLKHYHWACVVIGLLLLSLIFPILGVLHLILVLVDFFLTYSLVKEYNKKVREEIELMSGD